MQSNDKLKELISEIETKVKIEDIISEYVKLEKRGSNYNCLCPFHDDKNPSMSVSPSKKIFKCFSCGASGNAITFLQNFENISFIEAVKKISEKINIDWRKYLNEKVVKVDKEISDIWKINQEAKNFYMYLLKNELNKNNSQIANYLLKRKISKEEIEKFGLGYASKDSSLCDFLIQKGYEKNLIETSGLAKIDNFGNLKDYFLERLIFPIDDSFGNIIGFSGRIFDQNEKYVKYLNTKETKAFHKGNVLYNLSRAKQQSSLKNKIFIVEGFMDVISLSKLEVNNAIATMGTNLSKFQLNSIKTITNNIVLAMDLDDAGFEATKKITEQLLINFFNVNLILFSKYKDLDEMISNTSKEEALNIINSNLDYYNFLVERFIKTNPKNSYDSKKLENLFKTLSKSNSLVEKNKWINLFNSTYDINKNDLRNLLKLDSNENELIINEVLNLNEENKISYKKKEIINTEKYLEIIKENEITLFNMILFNLESFEIFIKSNYLFNNENFRKIVSNIEKDLKSNPDASFEEIRDKNIKNPFEKSLKNKVIIKQLIEKLKFDINEIKKHDIHNQLKKANKEDKIYYLNLLKNI